MKTKRWIALTLLFVLAAGSFAWAEDFTRAKAESYLKEMGLKYIAQDADRLSFETGFPDGKKHAFLMVADSKRKFAYLAVLDIMKLPAGSPKVCEITRKIASLNYGLVMAKLEWDEKGGEVRLSISMSTEQGLSKQAFSSAITTLLLSAEQVEKALK